MITEGSQLWQYLTEDQRLLCRNGAFLLEDSTKHPDVGPTDYSYLVFSFAKLYEGFLKHLFFDLGMISKQDYVGERFRIGKALSPTLMRMLKKRSVYGQLKERYSEKLADTLWYAWKEGRNMVFHYFPHNYRALTLDHAKALIQQVTSAMDTAVTTTNVHHREEIHQRSGIAVQQKMKEAKWKQQEENQVRYGSAKSPFVPHLIEHNSGSPGPARG